MQTSLSDAQCKLMCALRFTEEDLDANAHGYLSFGQRLEHRGEEVPLDSYASRPAKAALVLFMLALLGTLWLCGEIQFRTQNSALEQCAYYQTVAPNADPSDYYSYEPCLRREGYGGISTNQLVSFTIIAIVVAGTIVALASKVKPGTPILASSVRPGTPILKDLESVDGLVKLHVETDQSDIIGYYIELAEMRFQVQPEVYHAFEHGLPYRIYYRPSHYAIQPAGTILSVEYLRGS